ncbi:MAG: CYTH domain-containing protein [Micavibrio sp.]|nr:CYTH domain-containing protein [Micavibrio sp.]
MAIRQHKSEDEQEVKIRLSQGDLEKVFNALAKKYEPAHISHKYMPRAYYDTPRLDLYRKNLAVRMQYKEGKNGNLGGYEQTVKIELPPPGVMAEGALFRREAKDVMPNHKPDLSAITDAEAKKAFAPFVKKKLSHIFTAAIERRYFDIKSGHGKNKSTVEVAFDVGEIILTKTGQRATFYEIELERKAGNAAAIDALREEILKIAPKAEVQPLAKSHQGSQLYQASRRPRR